MPVVAAGAQMSGDALALEKDLDGARGQPHLDFAAGKAIRHAVEMTLELDMVVDTDPTETPLGKGIGFCWQRVEVRPIDLFEQCSAGDPKPPDRSLVIQLAQQLADRRIQFGQTVEAMWRRRPSSQRSIISTATSTFALSRVRRGRAGRIAVS